MLTEVAHSKDSVDKMNTIFRAQPRLLSKKEGNQAEVNISCERLHEQMKKKYLQSGEAGQNSQIRNESGQRG